MTSALTVPASGATGDDGPPRGRAAAALHLLELRDQRHGMVELVAAGGIARRLSPAALWARAAVMQRVHGLFGGSTALIGFNGRAAARAPVVVPRLPLERAGREAAGIAERAQARLDATCAAAARTVALGAVTPGPLQRGSVPGLGEIGAPGLWPAFDLAWARAMRADRAVGRLHAVGDARLGTLGRAGAVLDRLGATAPPPAGAPDDDAIREAIAFVGPPAGVAPAAAARVLGACRDAAAAGLLWEMMASGSDRVPHEWAAVLVVLTALAEEAAAAA